MNAPIDMVQCERRTADGYPEMSGPTTRPRARVECAPGGAITGNTLDQRTDNSVNKALPWIVVAGVSFAALALVVSDRLERERAIQDALQVSRAQIRMEFAETVAELKERVRRAEQDSAIAKDWTDQKNAELKVLRSSK